MTDRDGFLSVWKRLRAAVFRDLGPTTTYRKGDYDSNFGSINGVRIPLSLVRERQIDKLTDEGLVMTYYREYSSRIKAPRGRVLYPSGKANQFNMDTLVDLVRAHLAYNDQREEARKIDSAESEQLTKVMKRAGVNHEEFRQIAIHTDRGAGYSVEINLDLPEDRTVALVHLLKEHGYL